MRVTSKTWFKDAFIHLLKEHRNHDNTDNLLNHFRLSLILR